MSGTIYGQSSVLGRVGGITSVTIDGEALDIAGSPEWDATNIKREAQINLNGVGGYSELYKTGMIGFKARDSATMIVANLMNKTAAEVVMILANGKVLYGYNMFCSECAPVAAEDGTFQVRFESAGVSESSQGS